MSEQVEQVTERLPLSTAEAAFETRVTLRQLNHWIRKGYVRVNQSRPGTGYPMRVPEHEVRVLRLMGSLVRAGCQPHLAASLARALIDGEPAWVVPGRLWLTGDLFERDGDGDARPA